MTTDSYSPTDAPPPAGPPPARSTGWVALLVTLAGTVAILGLVLQSVLVGISGYGKVGHATYMAAVDGVTALDVETSDADMTVRFGDVQEATLEVSSSGWRRNVEWVLENDNGVLRVTDDRGPWFWPDFGSSRTIAELVLPRELEGVVSADLDLSAGSLNIEGDLDAVGIDISAGSLTFVGASSSLSASVSAGEVDVTTSEVATIDVDVSAGRFIGTFTGAQPTSTTISVSAGDAIVDLPDGEYALAGEVSAGDRTIDVRTNPSSPHTLTVDVSAGDATVRYAD